MLLLVCNITFLLIVFTLFCYGGGGQYDVYNKIDASEFVFAGLEFTCRERFKPQKYTRLRYLDATGSLMEAEEVASFRQLIFLSLAHCKITQIKHVHFDFPNLLFLDLSHNNIEYVQRSIFDHLRSIREVKLSWNPSVDLFAALNQTLPSTLSDLDLSGNFIRIDTLENFLHHPNKNLKLLNISYASISTLVSFRNLPNLERFDISHNDVVSFPSDLYDGLGVLEEIYADNPKLCCPQLLSHNLKQCFATPDEISSCENLLRSNLYRISLWVFAITSIVGNFASLISR